MSWSIRSNAFWRLMKIIQSATHHISPSKFCLLKRKTCIYWVVLSETGRKRFNSIERLHSPLNGRHCQNLRSSLQELPWNLMIQMMWLLLPQYFSISSTKYLQLLAATWIFRYCKFSLKSETKLICLVWMFCHPSSWEVWLKILKSL